MFPPPQRWPLMHLPAITSGSPLASLIVSIGPCIEFVDVGYDLDAAGNQRTFCSVHT